MPMIPPSILDFQTTALLRCAIVLAVMACIGMPDVAKADRRDLELTSTTDLRFGTFAVIDRGSRTVSATGNVTSSAILSTSRGDTGPAQFTLVYDRGNNGRQSLDLVIEIILSPPQPARQGGVTAQLSAFDSTIPGHPRIVPGQPVRITIDNCRSRQCIATFAVGGTIDITRSYGGGNLNIPLLFDATIISRR